MKTCTRCHVEKQITDFRKRGISRTQSRCLDCEHEVARAKYDAAKNRLLYLEKYIANPDKAEQTRLRELKRASRRRSYAKNKAKVLAQAAIYRAAHKSEEHAARAAHYQRNKERVAEITRAYRLAHPELYAEAFARRRAAVRHALPAWADLEAIKQIYVEARRLTVETGEPHEVDHYYPLQGRTVCGLHCEANLRVVHRSINRSKLNTVPA